jgi:catechol 2,3-dioxygenase-like lactoylglutathione lyase family enzyme
MALLSRFLAGTLLLATSVKFVLLASVVAAQTSPPPAPDLVGVGNFKHVVANIEKSIAFYRDALGMEQDGPIRNLSTTTFGNLAGIQSRLISLHLGSNVLGVELIEFKGADHKTEEIRFQDPGTATLVVLVRDIDAIVVRLKAAGGRVFGNTSSPFPTPTGNKQIFMKDPDGFIVRLEQGKTADRLMSLPGNAVGLGFEVAVDSTEKTKQFYRDLFKLDFRMADVTNPDDDTVGKTLGALFLRTPGWFPNKSFSMGFIEYKDIDRKIFNSAVQDPGTPILQLNVRDLDGLLKKLKAAGYPVILPADLPVTLDEGRFVIVKDPNDLRLELVQH